jgi:hypothetical protein
MRSHSPLPATFPAWLSNKIITYGNRLDVVMGSITISPERQHTLRPRAGHIPQSRPPESNIEVDVSTESCVASAPAKACESKARSGSMHAYARPSFEIAFEILSWMPINSRAPPHRPRAARQNEDVPRIGFYRPACIGGPQRGRYPNLLSNSKPWTQGK